MKCALAMTCAVTALVCATAAQGQQQTETTTLLVTASIPEQCSVSADSLRFGAIDPAVQNEAETTISVLCSGNATYFVALDAGLNLSADSGVAFRNMLNANGDNISYVLSSISDFSTQWGDNDFASTFTDGEAVSGVASGGTSDVLTVYGRTDPLGSSPGGGGVFSDTVLVTVHF